MSKAAIKLSLSPESAPVHDHGKLRASCGSFVADLKGFYFAEGDYHSYQHRKQLKPHSQSWIVLFVLKVSPATQNMWIDFSLKT